MFETYCRFQGVTFSSAPASPDSVVFGACSSTSGKYFRMETWRPGEDSWSEFLFDREEALPFPVAHNNPIYFHGEFYCLGRKGNLAIFNASDNTWRVLDKPEPIYAELQVFDDDHEGAKFCYLVELGEDLVSVFMRDADEPPRVFKLDETNMAWTDGGHRWRSSVCGLQGVVWSGVAGRWEWQQDLFPKVF
nr:F-box/kelch-repeat protein At1g57790-like [Setaria viridis]